MSHGIWRQEEIHPAGSVEPLIGQRVRIQGDVHFEGGLYVEGTIQGAVIADEQAGATAVLTLAESGCIEGEVRAPVVILGGRLIGDVHASERIELGAGAKVEGNIYYKVVEMAAGAAITGRLIHDDGTPRQLSGPAAAGAEALAT